MKLTTLFATTAMAVALFAGAAVYVYFPYHLVETYQRGALAEHLAFVFLPLILWGLTPSHPPEAAPRLGSPRLLVLVLSTAALILVHSLTALIFMPFALLYAVLWLRAAPVAERPRRAWVTLLPLAIALGLAAFYWLPILVESRWVGLSAGLNNTGYLEHLAPLLSFVQPSLVFQYPPHQGVAADQPLGLLSLLLLLIMPAAAAAAWRLRETRWQPLAFCTLLSVSALFMTSDLSAGLWRALHNPLTFLQYPWRFMTLAALGLALGAALVLQRRPRLALAALPVIILHGMLGLQPVAMAAPAADAQAMWANDFAARQIGATWTAEYVPWWVQADRTAIPAALRVPLSAAAPSNGPQLSLLNASYTQSLYRVAAAAPAVLRFHQFYLPQWRVTLGGKPLATFPDSELGLLSVELPASVSAGGDLLNMVFEPTGIEQFAALVSLAAAAGVVWLWRGWWLAPVALCAAVVLVAAIPAAAAAQATPVTPLHASVSNLAELLAVRLAARTYRPGETLLVTLTWLARGETREDFKSFVQLLDPGGSRALAQSDSDPVGGFTPTSQWRSGEIVEETRALLIPADAPAGVYPLIAGMYRLQPLQNLPAARGSDPLPDGRIPLAQIQVADR